MKRSEMIHKIQKKLMGSYYPSGEDWAEQLLKIIEELGFAPPSYIMLPDSYDRSTGNYGYAVHEWEYDDNNTNA
jgi:hypothetical protein